MNVNYPLDCGLWRTAEGLASRNQNLKHYDFEALCKYPITLHIDYPNRFINTVNSEVEVKAKFKSGKEISFISFNFANYLGSAGHVKLNPDYYKKFAQYDNRPQSTGGHLHSEYIEKIYTKQNYDEIANDDIVTSFEVTIDKTNIVADVLFIKDKHTIMHKDAKDYTLLQRPQTYEVIDLRFEWRGNTYRAIKKVFLDTVDRTKGRSNFVIDYTSL